MELFLNTHKKGGGGPRITDGRHLRVSRSASSVKLYPEAFPLLGANPENTQIAVGAEKGKLYLFAFPKEAPITAFKLAANGEVRKDVLAEKFYEVLGKKLGKSTITRYKRDNQGIVHVDGQPVTFQEEVSNNLILVLGTNKVTASNGSEGVEVLFMKEEEAQDEKYIAPKQEVVDATGHSPAGVEVSRAN